MNWIARHWIKIAGIAVLGVLIFVLFGQQIVQSARIFWVTPSGSFEEYVQPAAPDYSDPDAWIALPDTVDRADVSPTGMDLDGQAEARADVFFLHPTTFIRRSGWNQPLDDQQSNEFLNSWVLPAQAAAFNGCCRVYIPRYRQATIASFFDLEGNGKKALELAYTDVVRAFDHFINNFSKGRPFILAGHSQGARHANRLLNEVISSEMISNQLIAAYTIGQPIAPNGNLPVCSSATQTGCQIGWNSQTRDAVTVIGRSDSICVNPLTWTSGNGYAPAELNLGSVDFGADAAVEEKIVDAQCEDGRLLLTTVSSNNFQSMPFGKGNYHRYEFSLYHMNIRQNAMARVGAFLAR